MTSRPGCAVLPRHADVDEAAQDLRAIIRAKLTSGELSSAKPEKVWAGEGTGQPCAACGLTITANDVEVEVDFPGAPAAMRLHRGCITMWDQLRHDQAARRSRNVDPDVA